VPIPELRTLFCVHCSGSGLIQSETFDLSLLSGQDNKNTSNCYELMTLPVIVIGSGIAGAALTLALQQRGIPVVCVEKDASFSTRRQGYGLTLQQGTQALEGLGFYFGRQALEESLETAECTLPGGGLNESEMDCAAKEDAHPGNKSGEDFGVYSSRHIVFDSSGRQLGAWGREVWDTPEQLDAAARKQRAPGSLVAKKGTRHNLHVARQELRARLLAECDPASLRWGASLERFEVVSGDGGSEICPATNAPEVRVWLSDGSELRGSLLVGCDGIRSAVRRLSFGEAPLRADLSPLRFLGCFVLLGIVPRSALAVGQSQRARVC
jgi:2-polyprenyl-6-methoxyphenol hydroxylase-like FAD-dependent oxidoreductase